MNLLEPVLKALGGIITGYSTNDTAVKMLFKKYGPFGGVILKTKDEFIKNTSKLVERDIINHRTIENELQKEEFKNVFQNMVSDVLTNSLYKNTDDISLVDIPEIEDTIDNLLNFYKDNNEEVIAGCLDILLPNIMVRDVISDNQLNVLSENIIDKSIKTLKNNQVIEDIIDGLYFENKEEKLSELISPKIFKVAADNLQKETNDFHRQLQINFNQEIDRMIDRLYHKLSILELLDEVERSIKDKTLVGLIGKENIENITNELLRKVAKFIKSNDGKRLIAKFLKHALDLLKEIDISVLSLLDRYIGDNLRIFMEDELPEIVKKLINWIKDNKGEIEGLVDDAILEVLGSSSGIKSKIKGILYDLVYNGEFAKKNDILGKLIEGIKNEVDINQLSQEVSDEIINFIDDNSIGEIIKILEDRGIIKIDELVLLIENNIDNLIDQIDLTYFDEFFMIKVGTIVDLDLKSFFEKNIKGILIKKLKQEFLFNKRLTRVLQREITSEILRVGQYKLVDVVSEAMVQNNIGGIKDKSLDELEQQRDFIVDRLKKTINDLIKDRSLNHFISNDIKEKLVKNSSERSTNYLENLRGKIEERKLTSFYDRLNKKEDVEDNLTNLMLQLINKNLPIMIEGKIEDVVADNLSNLPDKDIQGMVEEFMGQELKPITYFGAGLGLFSALLLYVGQYKSGISTQTSLPLSVFVYGIIGYMTNVIALKMIFKPYSEKKLLGMKVPFTPGVVAKQQSRFANSMSKFVGEELLDTEAANEIFKGGRKEIEEKFIQIISQDNYKLVEDILANNINFITDQTLTSFFDFIETNKGDLVDKLIALLEESDLLLEFNYRSLKDKMKKEVKELILNLDESMVGEVELFLNGKRSLNDTLPNSIKKLIYDKLDDKVSQKVRQAMDLLGDEEELEEVLDDFSGKFNTIIDQSINDLIAKSDKDIIKNRLKNYLVNKVRTEEAREEILDLIEDKLLKEIKPDTKIGNLFDGMLMKTLYSNQELIIESILDKGKKFLRSNKEVIKREAVKVAQRQRSKGSILKRGLKSLANKALDIDGTIRDVVDNLIDYKVPSFLDSQDKELESLLTKVLSRIENKKISEIGIDLSRPGIKNVVDELVKKEPLVSNLERVLDEVIDSIMQVKLRALLNIISINDLFDIMQVFDQEITILKDGLTDNSHQKQEIVQEEALELLIKVFDHLILDDLSIDQLTEGIELEEIDKSVKRILDIVDSSDRFNENLDFFVEKFFNEVKYGEIDEILDIKYLKQDIIKTLDIVFEQAEVKGGLNNELSTILEVIILNINDLFAKETKDFILNLGVASILDSLEAYFLELMNAVNIKEVTKREINNMNPEEIEELFNSFAKQYFKKLENYGWLGGGIGLVVELILLSVI